MTAAEVEPKKISGASAAERAVNAGCGLSAAGVHWGKRPTVVKPIALTERDRRLLTLLHDVNYLSASQLALLGWGGDSTCARRRLRLLHDRGFIDKFRPARPAGSYEWNYRLTVEGWRMLAEPGMAADGKHYKPAEVHSIAYVEHDLQVNALVLHLARTSRAGEGPLLETAR
jgi:Replication-relaxation